MNTSPATTLPNGDRLLFFQDSRGAIREARYDASSGRWDAASSFVVSGDAQKGTSLAVDTASFNYVKNRTVYYGSQDVGLVLQRQRQDQTFAVLLFRGTPEYTWVEQNNPDWANPAYACASTSKLAVSFAMDHSQALSPDGTGPSPSMTRWLNIFYQGSQDREEWHQFSVRSFGIMNRPQRDLFLYSNIPIRPVNTAMVPESGSRFCLNIPTLPIRQRHSL
jgi:hypothetical protein